MPRLRPQEERPPLPEFREEPVEPPLTLPPPPQPRERLSTGVRVFVRAIRLEGNTVFSTAQLAEVTNPYQGREVTTEDLLRLRDELTRYYVSRGYVNSGAVIPDQDVVDGVITLRIVEGTLDEVRVKGLKWLRPSFVENRIKVPSDRPLNANELQKRLQLLLTDPSIERLDARLGPGPRLGQSRLDVDVLEGRWFQVSGRVSNDRSPDVGAENGELEASFRTLFGFGDPLRLRFTGSEGLREGAFSYSIPLTASDFRMFLAGEFTHADVVAASVSELDIEGNTETISAGVHYPIYRSLEQDLALEMSLDRRWSETRLLGRPFSFSPGVRNGETDITALRLVQGWQYRGRDRALAARSTFSVGIDALGATTNRTGPDGRFFAWLGQAQWAERLDDRGQLMIVRGDVQVAADPLLPIEEFAIGGFNTVRGYRENQLVRDSGWDASAEWRIPLFRLPMPYLSQAPDDGLLQLAPFVDAGGGWNKDRATPNPDIIYSVGAGLRWTPAPGWSAVFYYGKALQDVRNPKDKDLQDDGIHFEVRVQFF